MGLPGWSCARPSSGEVVTGTALDGRESNPRSEAWPDFPGQWPLPPADSGHHPSMLRGVRARRPITARTRPPGCQPGDPHTASCNRRGLATSPGWRTVRCARSIMSPPRFTGPRVSACPPPVALARRPASNPPCIGGVLPWFTALLACRYGPGGHPRRVRHLLTLHYRRGCMPPASGRESVTPRPGSAGWGLPSLVRTRVAAPVAVLGGYGRCPAAPSDPRAGFEPATFRFAGPKPWTSLARGSTVLYPG